MLNNTNLNTFVARHCNLLNGGAGVLGSTLSTCRNMRYLHLEACNIDDDILNELAGVFTGMSKLHDIVLSHNNFGVSGCRTIATLLQNSCCNLEYIDLTNTGINDECATTLAKALKGNNKLMWLGLDANDISESGWLSFSIALAYFSNHTLYDLGVDEGQLPNTLSSLLQLNKNGDKEQVANQKVLPLLDMEPLLAWNMEGEGEPNLKALPYIVAWFDRAREYNQNNDNEDLANSIGARKLSAIFQCATALPLFFVPPVNTEGKMDVVETDIADMKGKVNAFKARMDRMEGKMDTIIGMMAQLLEQEKLVKESQTGSI